MKYQLSSYAKMMSPGLVARALQTFDKGTIVIVSVSWGAALVIVLFALYTLNASVAAKRQMIDAAAGEPSLPRMSTRAPEVKEIKPLVDRLQKRFPDINFSLGTDRSLTVSATDGSRFRIWLTVLSYIDTISPQYRWQMKDFCVGVQCANSVPMRAILTAQKISFSTAPAADAAPPPAEATPKQEEER